MYKLKRSFTALTGVLILGLAATTSMPHIGRGASAGINTASTSQLQNVKVVNTTAEPVPVQGTVQSAQSGTWNVGINNTPNVNVGNSSANPVPVTGTVNISGTPVVGLDAANNTVKFDSVDNTVKIDPAMPVVVRDVDNPARQPFQVSVSPVAVTPGISAFVFMTQVPAGKRLIIEQVTSQGSVSSGAAVQMQIVTDLGGDETSHAVVFTRQGTDGVSDYFAASELTRLYADPNSPVTIRAQGINGGGTFSFSISGYFVSLQ